MLRLFRSLPPIQCPKCKSANTTNDIGVVMAGDRWRLCYECGTTYEVITQGSLYQIPSVTPTLPPIPRCPHCEELASIHADEGEEICLECGLDPNDLELPSPEIAHLWKGPSDGVTATRSQLLRTALENNSGPPGTNLGKFFRNECGPHCALGDKCEQTVGQFAKCYTYRFKKDEEGNTRVDPKIAIEGNKCSALLLASSDGWYVKVKRYGTETLSKQQVGD